MLSGRKQKSLLLLQRLPGIWAKGLYGSMTSPGADRHRQTDARAARVLPCLFVFFFTRINCLIDFGKHQRKGIYQTCFCCEFMRCHCVNISPCVNTLYIVVTDKYTAVWITRSQLLRLFVSPDLCSLFKNVSEDLHNQLLYMKLLTKSGCTIKASRDFNA